MRSKRLLLLLMGEDGGPLLWLLALKMLVLFRSKHHEIGWNHTNTHTHRNKSTCMRIEKWERKKSNKAAWKTRCARAFSIINGCLMPRTFLNQVALGRFSHRFSIFLFISHGPMLKHGFATQIYISLMFIAHKSRFHVLIPFHTIIK